MKQQPGVMLYFDVRESIAQLSYEEKGMLLDAILDYGQHHTEPAFADRTLALIWPFVRKDIHRDAQRYRDRQLAGLQGAQKRWGGAVSDSKPVTEMPTTSASPPPASSSAPTSPAAAATPIAAAAQTLSTAPSALPRTNGSALPDLVAQYLRPPLADEGEMAARKAQALKQLRALPPEA